MILYSPGLVYGPLIRRYGGRRVGLVSPAIIASGYLVAALSSQLWLLFVGYAFVAGMYVSSARNSQAPVSYAVLLNVIVTCS